MATTNLQDLVVVITGAARGMGAEYTRAFSEAGSKVVALERSWEHEEEFRKELDANESILTLTCDVTSNADLDDAYNATLERFGTVDVLVNNAAFRTRDQVHEGAIGITILETVDSDWERAFQVNVFGALKVIRRFVQPMLDKKRGSIINVSTTGSIPSHPQWRPGSREQPYMATKAALTNMTLYLADEIKGHNIAVNVVFPPGARTTGYDERSAERVYKGLPPTRTLSGRADTVVPVTKFLASQDANGGVTGKMFTATQWNLEHGLGGHDAWLAPDPNGNPELTAKLLAGELGPQASRHGM